MQGKNMQEKGRYVLMQPGDRHSSSIANRPSHLPRMFLNFSLSLSPFLPGLTASLRYSLKMTSLKSSTQKKKRPSFINYRKSVRI